MSRLTSFALFLSVALGLMAVIHWYVWLRLVVDPALPPLARRAGTVALLFGLLSIPATFAAARLAPVSVRGPVALGGFLWMGVVFLLFTALGGIDLVRGIGALVQRLAGDLPPSDPGRRVTVARLLAGSVGLVTGGATLAAIRSALGPVEVREVRVRLARLPRALHGTTIVQITDIHVGPTLRRAFVERIVAQVNALSPDLVAITGDLVDGSVPELRHDVAPLGALSARYGAFFVTGNHEYYSGAEPWCRELRSLGIRVLRNERVSIGTGEASFDLAGVDDVESRRFGGGADLAAALAGRDPARELVLLAHQPRAAFEADRHGVGLQLSGHTHGGQIWPWNFLVPLQQPIVAGLGRIGTTQVYVSRGTGYWGPPMRLAAPAEITRVILESAEA